MYRVVYSNQKQNVPDNQKNGMLTKRTYLYTVTNVMFANRVHDRKRCGHFRVVIAYYFIEMRRTENIVLIKRNSIFLSPARIQWRIAKAIRPSPPPPALRVADK